MPEVLQATAEASTSDKITERDYESGLSLNLLLAPEKLNRWDCPTQIFLRQIQVVDENDAFLSHCRTIHSLPPPVKLRHDHVLGVVDVGPRGEVDNVVDELLGGEAADEAAGEEGLAGASGPDEGEGELVLDGQLQEKLLLQCF